MLDIIFFAAVALYIFFKLRSQFGKVDEDQKRDAIKKFLNEQANTNNNQADNQNPALQQFSDNNSTPAESAEKLDKATTRMLDDIDPQTKSDFVEVLSKSKVSVANFLSGASLAFELIIRDFSKGDKADLQKLLAPELYKRFSAIIDERIKNQETLSTNVISIDGKIVKSAQIVGEEAIISINFLSKQINYVLSSKDEVLDGSKDEINEISDVWTFSRNINSKNPNWTIISTSEPIVH